MMAFEPLFSFIMASLLLGLAPGPDNLFVLTQSALYGRKAGLLVTLGLCSGLIVHTTLVALGVAAVFQSSNLAFNLLKIIGVLYLLFLAWQAFHATAAHLHNNGQLPLTRFQLYRRGIIMNITNPKVSIFFLAFLPQFTNPDHGSLMLQLFLLGGTFMLVTLLVFGHIALLAGLLGNWLKQSAYAQALLNRLAGLVFIALALRLLFFELNA